MNKLNDRKYPFVFVFFPANHKTAQYYIWFCKINLLFERVARNKNAFHILHLLSFHVKYSLVNHCIGTNMSQFSWSFLFEFFNIKELLRTRLNGEVCIKITFCSCN